MKKGLIILYDHSASSASNFSNRDIYIVDFYESPPYENVVEAVRVLNTPASEQNKI